MKVKRDPYVIFYHTKEKNKRQKLKSIFMPGYVRDDFETKFGKHIAVDHKPVPAKLEEEMKMFIKKNT